MSTGYFYVLFLWVIAASDLRPPEIYKNLCLPLSTVTFTVNSYAYNDFYKYIYLFQKLFSVKSVLNQLTYMLYKHDITYNLISFT